MVKSEESEVRASFLVRRVLEKNVRGLGFLAAVFTDIQAAALDLKIDWTIGKRRDLKLSVIVKSLAPG